MSLTELFIIAVGLSMDAFAVAVCKGACHAGNELEKRRNRRTLFWRLSGPYALSGISAGFQVQQNHRVL